VPTGPQVGNRSPGHQECRCHIHVKDCTPQFGRAVFDPAAPNRGARVVDQDVQPAGLGDQAVHDCGRLIFDDQIGVKQHTTAAVCPECGEVCSASLD
jgi:hypothetical protein